MGNTHSNTHIQQSSAIKYQTEKDLSLLTENPSNTSGSGNETKNIVTRKNSRVKERVLRHFCKKYSKDNLSSRTDKIEQQNIFSTIVPKSSSTTTDGSTTTTTTNKSNEARRPSEESINEENHMNLSYSDRDSNNLETPSAEIDWSSVNFGKLHKTDDSSDTLANIIRDGLADELGLNKRDIAVNKTLETHFKLATKPCLATKSLETILIDDVILNTNSLGKAFPITAQQQNNFKKQKKEINECNNTILSKVDTKCVKTKTEEQLTDCNVNSLLNINVNNDDNVELQQFNFVAETLNLSEDQNILSKITEAKLPLISRSPTKKLFLARAPSTYDHFITDLNGNNNSIKYCRARYVYKKYHYTLIGVVDDGGGIVSSLTHTKHLLSISTLIYILNRTIYYSQCSFSNILRSVNDGSVDKFLHSEKSEIICDEQKNKLNLKVSENLEYKKLYKIIEKNCNNLDISEKLVLIQTNSWKTTKILETVSTIPHQHQQQQQKQQQYSFTDEEVNNGLVIRLRESSIESESYFTDPITSPSCATDSETFKSIENVSDSLNDISQFSKRSSSYQISKQFLRNLSVLGKLSRSEIVYLNIDSTNSKSNSESPEDDLQMAIHLRNKLAQMLSNEDQKTRADASTSSGIFNVARAKKVELHNLSSRLADNNLAGISPKILHDIQGTSSQSFTDHDIECNQTLSPSCFGSFGDSNVLKKVASFITAEKSSNNDVTTPRKSSLIPEKLDFSVYEKFEGQMLVKWITNSLLSTGCNLSEQTLNTLTQQYCTNLLSIGVIKPICEKTDKNDTFNPYQMYQWSHRESVTTSNPVTPGRLDADIIWPHASTPTSSSRIPRSVHVDIPTTDITQLNNYNNNNNNNINNNGNVSCNNNNIISKDLKFLSNGSNSVNVTTLDNSKRILCGDRKVFELKKSLLNCNTLSEVYEVVETLLPDRKPSSSIIVSFQSPNCTSSKILNETEETLYGSADVDVSQQNTNICEENQSPISSTKENLLETTEENSISNLCHKCGKNISSTNQSDGSDITNENDDKTKKIDKILQTSFDDKIKLTEENVIKEANNEGTDSDPATPTKNVTDQIDDYCKTSTPTKMENTDNLQYEDLKISPVVECGLPPPPPPPVPPPAPPLPPLLLLPPPKIPPPPAFPNFNNQRAIPSSLSSNQNLPNTPTSVKSPPTLQKSISTGSSTSPPSPAPFPMPPSSGSWFQTNNTLRKNAVNPPRPMKPLYWTRIVTTKPLFPGLFSEEKADSSPEEHTNESKPNELWQEIDETSLDNFVIDEFTDLFSRQAVVPLNKPTRVKSNLAKTIKILDSKRSQSVGIFYRSLHFDLEEIEHAIYHCDTSIVNLEILHHIMDIKATTEELAMIKEAAIGDTPLDAPEQFLLRISQISSSAERISCLVFQAEFDEGSTLVSRKLEVVKRLSEFLTDSDDLKLLFSIILTLGNYMNGGNRARGQADGFGLEILGKLKDVKSKDSKITLLHFIVKTFIGRKRKSGTPLVEIGLPIPEPSDVERAAAVDFDEVKLQILDLQKKLQICQNTTGKVINSSNEENIQPFKKKMEDFIEIGDKKIEKQFSKLEECRESFVKTMKFYHFLPKSGELDQCTPAQFFEYWTNFSNDFKDIWKKEITMLTNELIKKVKSQQKVQNTQSVTSSSRPKLKPGGLKDRLQRMAKK